jgi:hypothetical protein
MLVGNHDYGWLRSPWTGADDQVHRSNHQGDLLEQGAGEQEGKVYSQLSTGLSSGDLPLAGHWPQWSG